MRMVVEDTCRKCVLGGMGGAHKCDTHHSNAEINPRVLI